jgi:D-alanyl-D-alanine carboxypeptidase (penicillin-binding protein 5/6)
MRIKNWQRGVWRLVVAICILLALGVIFIGLVMSRDLPKISGEITYSAPPKSPEIAWPKQGQAAVALVNGDLVARFGSDKARPIASLTKVITSLVVLEKKPLVGDGPTITLNARDVKHYSDAIARNGSHLYVEKAEAITERQMLEAVILVSANNLAESLVEWAFGSFAEYKIAARRWIAENGLNGTKIGSDASGLDPGTISTPSDMVKIGQLALQNATLAEIIKQPTADFPLAGELRNTNKLVFEDYLGIKTGNSDQALSCLLFAKKIENETVVGVLMGQPFGSTFETAEKIVASLENNFVEIVVPAGAKVGQYNLPWGGAVEAVTTNEVVEKVLAGKQPQITLRPIAPKIILSDEIGELELGQQTSKLEIGKIIPQPSLGWRLQNLDKLVW